MKKIVRLTEQDLVRLVKKVIKEQPSPVFRDYMKEIDNISSYLEYDEISDEEIDDLLSKIESIMNSVEMEEELDDDEIDQILEYANDIYQLIYRHNDSLRESIKGKKLSSRRSKYMKK
jgi:Asp-tRNA(Asn)/Glu-tRNA(Gln) amidotransferase C subunit